MKQQVDGLVERIKHLRGEASQAKFAKICGVPQSTYARWELGLSPTAQNIVSICQATGVSADWLLGLKEGGAGASIVGSHNAQAINGGTASVSDNRTCKDCQTVAHLLETIRVLGGK